jgi:hypothetical protein
MPDSPPPDAGREQVPIDGFALEVARLHVEDVLVDLRDADMSAPFCGNGLVIRDRNGEYSPIIRLSTREALMIGVRAYLAALGRAE